MVLCTRDRACFFGEVVDGGVALSALGMTAYRFFASIPDHFDRVVLDAFVVMPNHVHAIVGLLPVEPLHATALRRRAPSGPSHAMSDRSPVAGSLSAIVRSYKSAVTRWARQNEQVGFAWQPRFYDRVIRTERELHATRRYVLDNPLKWEMDRYHPDRLS